jgi:hypothetical protein
MRKNHFKSRTLLDCTKVYIVAAWHCGIGTGRVLDTELKLNALFRIRIGSASGSVIHKYGSGSGSFPFLIKMLSGLKKRIRVAK